MKLVAFNKPFDVLSQFRADGVHRTLIEFLHDKDLRIAGRLDRDSEGLLLLTNHGQLNQCISHPKHKQWKTYIVQVDGQITPEAVQQLQHGVQLNDGLTLPAQTQIIDEPHWLWERVPPVRFRKNIPTSWLEIKICEGRNRQVRRMTASVGFPTLRLIRIQIGSIHLLDLKLELGQSTELDVESYAEFRKFTAEASKSIAKTSNHHRHYHVKTRVLRSRKPLRKH